MRTAFTLVVVTIAASFLISSCAPPEPTPRNVHVGMTKEQVLRKFGQPDLHQPRREFSVPKYMPTLTTEEWSDIVLAPENQGLLEGLAKLPPKVVEETITEPEQFRYFNDDGSLVTIVQFGEDDRVTNVLRAPQPRK